ncbi:hypothetical protein [Brevibacillus borstelensis]|uniref:hypothetical protein n=1 Tax=Brevibacillus borstelensis TaxID=45462 RepID=UPI0030C616B1
MWTIALILLVSLLTAMIETPYLRRNSMKKELAVFFILLLIGTGLSVAEVLEADIPNPLDWIAFVYKPFSDMIFGAVKH